MKNYIQAGKIISFVAATIIPSGAVVKVGDLIGVSCGAYAIDDTAEVSLTGVYSVPKAVGAVTQGAKLYFDEAEELVTTDDASGANAQIGYAFEAALNADANVNVKLMF